MYVCVSHCYTCVCVLCAAAAVCGPVRCAAGQLGRTALYSAAEENHTAVMQCLLDNNADTELPTTVQYKDIWNLYMPDCVCVCVAVTVHPHIVLQCIVNSVCVCGTVCISLSVCGTVCVQQ